MSITLRLLAFALILVATVLFASAIRIESKSSSQNANSSTTTNRNQNQNDSRSITPAAKAQQDFSQNTWELPDDADKTKNPVEATEESIAKGKELYFERTKGNCVFCHGDTGSGNEANLPRLRRKPADLSNKERMTAMTDGEIFWKLSKGINGIMPAGENRMKEAEERWHVVNYIRTLAKTKE
jgi:mono/diheme cytochrome c family protein